MSGNSLAFGDEGDVDQAVLVEELARDPREVILVLAPFEVVIRLALLWTVIHGHLVSVSFPLFNFSPKFSPSDDPRRGTRNGTLFSVAKNAVASSHVTTRRDDPAGFPARRLVGSIDNVEKSS